MLRNSVASAIFSSSSLGNVGSQNSSRSSFLGGKSHTQRPFSRPKDQKKAKTTSYNLESSQEDLDSYLSSFNGSKSAVSGKKKHQRGRAIDWEKLVETGDTQNVGVEYEAGVYTGFEQINSDDDDDDEHKASSFLKTPDTAKKAHSKVGSKCDQFQKQVTKSKHTSGWRGSAGTIKLSDLNYVKGSNDWTSTFGEDGSISISDSESKSLIKEKSKSMSVSEGDDSSINVLAHVKVASDLTLSDQSDTDSHQESLPVKQLTKSESEVLKESSEFDISMSESLNIHKNVFSIDELNGGITPDGDSLEERSVIDDVQKNSESNHGPNFTNVFSIDDLEGKGTDTAKNELTTKTETKASQKKTPSLAESNSTVKQKDLNLKKNFKFSASSKFEPPVKSEAVRSHTISDTEEPPSVKDSIATVSSHDHSEAHGYSEDEDFESETLSEADSNGEISPRSIPLADSDDDDTSLHHAITERTLADSNRESAQSEDGSYSRASDEENQQEMTEDSQNKQHRSRASESSHKSLVKKISNQKLADTRQPQSQATTDSFVPPRVVIGPHYGKEYLDPSPILPHVVSPDALEVLTAYSPSTVALTDMLRAQLHLTKQLVVNSQQLVANLSSSISADYHYTTLEETKEYIARYRPRIITAAEAMQLVERELT